MTSLYILGPGHVPVPVSDVLEWGKWMAGADRRVARDRIEPDIEISTVFLGIDHAYDGRGPVLFETMAFDDYGGGETHRYATWDEALAGHAAVVERIKARIAAAGDVTR